MKNQKSIPLIILRLVLVLFIVFPIHAFAQTDRKRLSLFGGGIGPAERSEEDKRIQNFEALSREEKQRTFLQLGDSEKVRVFNLLSDSDKLMIFEILSESDKVWIFENLNDVDKQNIFRVLSDADKVWIFENLSDVDKQEIFQTLSEAEQVTIFGDLSDSDKRRVFRDLDYAGKQKIFKDLKEIDKTRVFRSLRDEDKVRLFNTMSLADKERWLRRFPELETIISAEGVPPGRPEKPLPGIEEIAALSEIEKILSGEFPTDVSRELRQFGYDFFQKDISTFAPVSNLPVGPDYVIGPGDNFTIYLWGKTESTYFATVTRDGSVHLPRLGSMNVSGLTYEELKRYLMHKFKQYYPDFQMSITMGALRTIEIFVVGEAVNPGTYSVSSLSTIITALFASGGPTKRGSLRSIKLFRHGKLTRTLDLYEFFIKGIKVNDVRLQQGDTIFIPVIGPVMGIAGLVKRPGIYEFKETHTIGDAIELAGGVLPIGHLQNVAVERVTGHKRRVIRSFNLDPSSPGTDEKLRMPLQDFDLIRIHPVHLRLQKVVYLEGHVKYPREYELKTGMRLRDLIPSYDSLPPEPYLPQAEIIRLEPPDFHPEIIEFNLGALLAGDESHNLLLQDQDRIKIYGRWEKRTIPQVTIQGAVHSPGTYTLYKGMTIKDLIFQADNLTRRAYLAKADLSRIVPGETGTETIKLSFSPKNAMAGKPEDNLVLQEDDIVFVREIPRFREALGRKVFLEGEFLFPGEYAFSEGERLASVIERAGGLTEEAYPFGAFFLRESIKEIQRQRLTEYISRLEQDILTTGALAAEQALDKEEAAILQQSLAQKRLLLDKLRASEPTGRMVINLDEVLLMPSTKYNFELRSGDRLVVNKRPHYVNVMGEVYNPTALFAEEGKTVGYYLNLVGGVTDDADKKQIYVVKANGSVFSKSQEGFFGMAGWDSKQHRWTMGGFESIVLDPGDTIIVPRKIMKFAWLRLTKDITTILYQIALTAGIIVTIFKD